MEVESQVANAGIKVPTNESLENITRHLDEFQRASACKKLTNLMVTETETVNKIQTLLTQLQKIRDEMKTKRAVVSDNDLLDYQKLNVAEQARFISEKQTKARHCMNRAANSVWNNVKTNDKLIQITDHRPLVKKINNEYEVIEKRTVTDSEQTVITMKVRDMNGIISFLEFNDLEYETTDHLLFPEQLFKLLSQYLDSCSNANVNPRHIQ